MALKSGRVGIHPSQVDPITGMLLSGPSGTSDYEQLSNLPKVNSVTLKGNKSLSDLGIPTSLAGQSDTDITDPAVGQILQYNGTGWENVYSSVSPTTLATLQDVTITDPAAGQTLEYNGTGWENVFASIAPTTLAALQDVDITSPADGDYLVYDGNTHEWVNSGSAPTPTYTDVTCTFYGAVEDIISFTDAAGVSHLVTFGTDASSKQETFKIDPSGSSIIFTSSVAKNPDNLSESFSKSVTITSATTEIRVMPDNALYWWGYEDNLDNPSKWPNQTNNVACTQNKNSYTASPNSGFATIGKKNFTGTLSKAHCIMTTSNKNNTFLFIYGTNNDSNSPGANNTIEHLIVNNTNTGTFDIGAGCQQGTTATIYAMWYE